MGETLEESRYSHYFAVHSDFRSAIRSSAHSCDTGGGVSRSSRATVFLSFLYIGCFGPFLVVGSYTVQRGIANGNVKTGLA